MMAKNDGYIRMHVSQLAGIEFQSNDFIHSYGIKSISTFLIKPINGYRQRYKWYNKLMLVYHM